MSNNICNFPQGGWILGLLEATGKLYMLLAACNPHRAVQVLRQTLPQAKSQLPSQLLPQPPSQPLPQRPEHEDPQPLAQAPTAQRLPQIEAQLSVPQLITA
jgi:hypothetical protein